MIDFNDPEITKIRKEKDFVPSYSCYEYERKKNIFNRLALIGIYSGVTIGGLSLLIYRKKLMVFVIIMALIEICIILYMFYGYRYVDQWKWKSGYRIAPQGISFVNGKGKVTKQISYDNFRQEILEGNIRYETSRLVLGKGKNKIGFPYEIGQSSVRNQIEKNYAKLENYIGIKLPNYKRADIDLLDRKYYYTKCLKWHTISLIGAILIGTILLQTSDTIEEVYFFCAFIGLWETCAMCSLHQAAVNATINNKKIRTAFSDVPNPSQFGWIYKEITLFVIVIVLSIFYNLHLAGLFLGDKAC